MRIVVATLLAFLSLGVSADDWQGRLVSRLDHGDIVFRSGIGQISDTIAAVATSVTGRQTRWTHAGIAVRLRPNGKLYILHAIEERGVTLEAPGRFFDSTEASAGDFRRIKQGRQAAQAALQFLGRPFDTSFSLAEQDSIYCSELVWLALQDTGIQPEVRIHNVPVIGKAVFPDDLIDALSTTKESRP
jgi:hypothetical protein